MAKVQSVRNISGEVIYPKTVADAVMYNGTKTMGALAGTSVYINSESSTVTELGDPIDASSLGGHGVDYFATKSEVNTLNQKIENVAASTAAMISAIDDFDTDTNAIVDTHNVSTTAHNDIRVVIDGLTARLNALANSDDVTLDQMAEIVTYIKNNHDVIDGVTTSKVNVSDIIDNLITNVSNKPLSAAQGVALKALIDAIPAWAKQTSKPAYTADEVGALPKTGGYISGGINVQDDIAAHGGSARISGNDSAVLSDRTACLQVTYPGENHNPMTSFIVGPDTPWVHKYDENGNFKSGYKIYSENFKPTATDVGALPVDGNANSATKLQTARHINGVEFDGSADVTVYSPYERTKLAKQLTDAGWYRVAEGSGSDMSVNMVVHKPYGHLSPMSVLLSIDINHISSTANIVQLNSSFSSSSIPKIRVNKLNGDYCIEFYFNGSTVAESVYIDFFNIHGTGTFNTVDFTAGAIPTDYTTTEFAISHNPMKSSVFEGNLKGIAYSSYSMSLKSPCAQNIFAYVLQFEEGRYTFSTSTGTTNLPKGVSIQGICDLLVQVKESYMVLKYYPTSNGNVEYINVCNNGTWTGWKRTLNEDDLASINA